MKHHYFILFGLVLMFNLNFSFRLHAQQRTGKDYAVFFYVTDFKPGWGKLPETKIEAEELKKELETNFGFICELVPNPTKKQMSDKLRAYNQKVTENDQVLYFFSMHGHYDPTGDRGYLVGSDGLATDTTYFDTWFSYDDVRTDISKCKAKHILVTLDACHSGSFGIRTKGKPQAPPPVTGEDCQTKIAGVMQFQGRQYCAAGNKDTKTPAKSLFAARFLEALRKGGDGGIVRFDDLEYFLGKIATPEPETGTFSNHQPGGDFIFVRETACVSNLSDSDGDGVPDLNDKCPSTWGSGADGCSPAIGSSTDIAADLEAWKKAKNSNTSNAYQEYLRLFPNGEFKELANAALRRLEDEALSQQDDVAWEIAKEKNTIVAYEKYLKDYPAGKHRAEANDAIKKLVVSDDGLVLVRGGTFQMGCTSEQQDCGSNEKPVHTVTLSDFYIGKYEVTQALWREVMGENPASFKNCDQCPVESVSWEEVQVFLEKLNAKYPNRNYRLPTEAEWEYAAREGGKAVLFGNGKNILDPAQANFDASKDYKTPYSVVGTYRAKTTPVGTFAPNALGLYDMAGNVWEWCSDWYGSDYYKNSSQNNPTGATTGTSRVLRGGSWFNYPQNCRVANRSYYTASFRYFSLGFRLARTR